MMQSQVGTMTTEIGSGKKTTRPQLHGEHDVTSIIYRRIIGPSAMPSTPTALYSFPHG
jgi:hypothetical protein